MKEGNYHKSFFNRLTFHFNNSFISNIIFLCDEDNDIIDNVAFIETDFNNVVGFYMNGMNPLISGNPPYKFDDFNLFSLYNKITEIKKGLKKGFYVKKIKVVFHPSYNEMLAIFLSSEDNQSSVLLVFSSDEIDIMEGVNSDKYIDVVKKKLAQFNNMDFLVFCKNEESDWHIVTK